MRYSLGLVFGLGLCALPTAPASAQGIEGEAARCVQTTRIDRTEVIGDNIIVFYMRGRSIYVNRLDRSCPGLDRGRPFSYRTTNSRLCSVDTITVLENSAFGLSRGFSCGLGRFEPATEEMIALLKGEEQEAEVTVVPVEVVDIPVEGEDVPIEVEHLPAEDE